jgi:hypothetical protein
MRISGDGQGNYRWLFFSGQMAEDINLDFRGGCA